MNHGTFNTYTNHACRCDECKAGAHAYYEAHKERMKETGRAWKAANPERVAEINYRYRMRKAVAKWSAR